MKILLIDDDPFGTDFLQMVSQKIRPDWELLTARDGQSGLQIAHVDHPVLILLDYRLPDLTGAEIFQALRADAATAKIPVIMLTGDARPESRDTMTALGVDGFLVKPFDLDELLARITTLIGG